jgi:hypothetical protein
MLSKVTLWISIFIMGILNFVYYPKHEKQATEATISWDVSGYYMYLPAFFIYGDAKTCAFAPEILKKYRPTPDFQQAFKAPNGNYVFKYSIGQAIAMSPGFFAGHLASSIFDYPIDGFSYPYQLGISIWGFIITALGLYFLRRILLDQFDDVTTSICILVIGLGTNYTEYGGITNSMQHNYLFLGYALLIFVTDRFYKQPSYTFAILLGTLCGWMALTRPTEIIAVFIPLLWGMQLNLSWLKDRILYIIKLWPYYLLAVMCTALIGMIQPMYWHYAADQWIVYSYEDQGFSFLRPHLIDGLFSGRAGWLMYTPVMIFALLGFGVAYFKKSNFLWSLGTVTLASLYLTFAWDIWWYGGSIGQRALVQIYPILSFPLAYLIEYLFKTKLLKWLIFPVISICFVYNIWLIHQAHKGGLLVAGEMTFAYLKKIAFKITRSSEDLKLLDTDSTFDYPILKSEDLISTYKQDSMTCLRDTIQFSPTLSFVTPKKEGWLRVSANYVIKDKEWESWRMTQLMVRLYRDGKVDDTQVLRVQRYMDPNQAKTLHIDIPISSTIDSIQVQHWHADGKTELCFNGLKAIYHSGQK